jgi:hypothetical protein
MGQSQITSALQAARSAGKPIVHESIPPFDQLTEYVYQESTVESKGVVTVKVAKAPVTNKDDGKEMFLDRPEVAVGGVAGAKG